MRVTIDGVLDWMLDLLTTYTHNSELQAIMAPPLISTFHKSPAKLFPACCALTSRSLAKFLTMQILQLHALKSSLNVGSLPNASFSHRLP
jgi:hypothetical protein